MLQREQTNRQRRAAFTLMEMLVVVAIIVALAGLGGYYFLGALEDAKVDTAKTNLKTLTTACEAYSIKRGFPDSLEQLLVRDENGGPYVKGPEFLLDPWQNHFTYNKAGTRNNGLSPDISFTHPKTGEVIGNWPRGK
jgi:general secretion pathway protein G